MRAPSARPRELTLDSTDGGRATGDVRVHPSLCATRLGTVVRHSRDVSEELPSGGFHPSVVTKAFHKVLEEASYPRFDFTTSVMEPRPTCLLPASQCAW